MKCPHCGMGNPVGANFCNHCGLSLTQEVGFEPPNVPPAPAGSISFQELKNLRYRIYRWWFSLTLVTGFCFPPCGVVAIIYAVKARTNLENGKIYPAKYQLQSAKTWCWASFFIGLITIPIAYLLEEM